MCKLGSLDVQNLKMAVLSIDMIYAWTHAKDFAAAPILPQFGR